MAGLEHGIGNRLQDAVAYAVVLLDIFLETVQGKDDTVAQVEVILSTQMNDEKALEVVELLFERVGLVVVVAYVLAIVFSAQFFGRGVSSVRGCCCRCRSG